ncbi:EF-hand domain-containing protein [Actinomadura sp. KC216]|uniref:EF-hand domain-containing protein n=1 Tax=Actinomadura sp. KC216 TaxID=2530370 RepID=UPI00140438B5|nr:EF-hand domain-containing protein [Actinomadura sp. KC216]
MSDNAAFRYGRTFDLFDVDHSGSIESSDLAALAGGVVRAGNVPVDSAKSQALHAAYQRFWEVVAHYADADYDGRVTREEFINAMSSGMSDGSLFTESIADAAGAEFAVIDTDDDGRIDLAELQTFLENAGLVPDEARQAAADMDADGNGSISTEEYRRAWLKFYLEIDPETKSFLGGPY